MALCINDSGTWRKISTNCINDSGTWRKVATGCINNSGTWRCYGFLNIAICPLGSNVEGGYLICKSSGTAWIVAPSSTQVNRNFYNINDAVTSAQSVTGCTGWFVPTISQLVNPGYCCRTYWDSYCGGMSSYWSSTEYDSSNACFFYFGFGSGSRCSKNCTRLVRAFRCVTY